MNREIHYIDIEPNKEVYPHRQKNCNHINMLWIEVVKISKEINLKEIKHVTLANNGNPLFRWPFQFLKFDEDDNYYNFYIPQSDFIDFDNIKHMDSKFDHDYFEIISNQIFHHMNFEFRIDTTNIYKKYNLKNPCQIGFSMNFIADFPHNVPSDTLIPIRVYKKYPLSTLIPLRHKASICDSLPNTKIIIISEKKIKKLCFLLSEKIDGDNHVHFLSNEIDFINHSAKIFDKDFNFIQKDLEKDLNKNEVWHNLEAEQYKAITLIIKKKFYNLSEIIISYLYKKKYSYSIELDCLDNDKSYHFYDKSYHFYDKSYHFYISYMHIEDTRINNDQFADLKNIELYVYKKNYMAVHFMMLCLRYVT